MSTMEAVSSFELVWGETSRAAEIEEHLVNSIEASPLRSEPFPYVYIEGFFPEDIYKELLAMLPGNEFYEPVMHKDAVRRDGSSSRIQASLSPDRLDYFPAGPARELWTDVVKALQADSVRMALLSKLEPGIRESYSEPLEEISAYSRPALNRDVAGYKILPHPDTKAKVMSGLIYLPNHEKQSGLGTSFYVRDRRGFRMRPSYKRVVTLPFAPNSGPVFAVSKRSFHGREPLPEGCGIRDYLAMTFYNDPTRRGY